MDRRMSLISRVRPRADLADLLAEGGVEPGRRAAQRVELVADEGELLRDAVVHLAGQPLALLDRDRAADLLEQQRGLEAQRPVAPPGPAAPPRPRRGKASPSNDSRMSRPNGRSACSSGRTARALPRRRPPASPAAPVDHRLRPSHACCSGPGSVERGPPRQPPRAAHGGGHEGARRSAARARPSGGTASPRRSAPAAPRADDATSSPPGSRRVTPRSCSSRSGPRRSGRAAGRWTAARARCAQPAMRPSARPSSTHCPAWPA